MQAQQQKKMKLMGKTAEEEMNDVEVPTDRSKPLDVKEENRKYLSRALDVFGLPSLTIPRLNLSVCSTQKEQQNSLL